MQIEQHKCSKQPNDVTITKHAWQLATAWNLNTHYHDAQDVKCNFSFKINYCPYCGEELN